VISSVVVGGSVDVCLPAVYSRAQRPRVDCRLR
jgi:hypothetical protein